MNKDKGSAVMCELCRLDLAGTAGTVADEQTRETLAAVGSALVRGDRVARRNRDYLDLHGVTAINLVRRLARARLRCWNRPSRP